MRTTLALVLLVACSSPKPVPEYRPVVPPPVEKAPPPAQGFAYPAAQRGDVVETHHGVKVADPYRWLEDMESAQTKAWVKSENAQTDAYFAEIAGRDALKARIGELISYESVSVPGHHGRRYVWIYRDGKSSQPVVQTATSLDAPATTLLDPNQISTDGSLAFAGLSFTEDGARFAYGLASGGGDWHTWRFRDVANNKDLTDEIANIKYYWPVFTHDGKGVYYSRFPAPAAGKELTEPDHDCKVYFHKMGTPAAGDVVVYERADQPSWQYKLAVTDDGRYLVIAIGDGEVGDRNEEQIAYLELGKPGAKPVSLIDKYEAEYEFVGSDGPTFYFLTTAGAPHKRIIAIDVRTPARDRWKEILPDGQNPIEDVSLVGHQLLVTTLVDAHSAVTAYDLKGKKLRDIELPGIGAAHGFHGTSADKETFYQFASFITPSAVYRYDIATGKSTLWKAPKVPFDAGVFETKQVFFPSKDGTKIPMFVVAKKGLALDGNNPTLMEGYGFGGITVQPFFQPTLVAWLERGGVFAWVGIRGGGEYGVPWHEAAKRTHRQTGWDDFIAAGEWLVANKYTSPAHLGAMGTSGGGMLVGGVTVQRPDLFGATVPIAGVLDLLRFQLFGEGAGWQGDLGSPDDAAEFPTLRAISPLHNIRANTKYPAMLVITSDHDVRVAPLHSYKFAAAAQAAQVGPGRIVLRVETETGHGLGSTQAQRIEQSAEIFAFLAKNLGLKLE